MSSSTKHEIFTLANADQADRYQTHHHISFATAVNARGGELGKATLGDPADTSIQLALNVTRAQGYFDIVAHGTPNAVEVLSHGKKYLTTSAEEIADMILMLPNYRLGFPVRLLSCRTGATPAHGGEPIAQRIAQFLCARVLAPTMWVQPMEGGTVKLVDLMQPLPYKWGEYIEYVTAGEWILFYP